MWVFLKLEIFALICFIAGFRLALNSGREAVRENFVQSVQSLVQSLCFAFIGLGFHAIARKVYANLAV
jgi:hypothetical protein